MKIGLNLGCGTRIFSSSKQMESGGALEIFWRNMDAIKRPGVDLVANWTDLPTIFNEPEFDIIVANHVYEHQNCGMQPIRQCYEVLKPGGSLIVAVPDVRKLAGMWLRGELTTQIYLTNIYGPYDGTEESIHRWGFDEESLSNALWASIPKWRMVKPFNWRAIPGAEIPRDDRWILCLEAVK